MVFPRQRQGRRGRDQKAPGDGNGCTRHPARAAVMGATQAPLQNVRVQLDYTRIAAPISGRTGTISVTVGNTVRVSDAQPLVILNQVKPIRVQASLPQQFLSAVREAMAA